MNWELARQVGVANAVEAGPDREPTEGDLRMLEEAVRVAELQVGRFTGLPAPGGRRAGARRPPRRLGERERREPQDPARAGRPASSPTRSNVAPASSSRRRWRSSRCSCGSSRRSCSAPRSARCSGCSRSGCSGSTTSPFPDPGPGQLLFVVPNLAAFERDWSLDPREFRTFVALHEVTHRFEFAQPWARDRFQELLDDYLSTLKLDVEGMQARLSSLDPADPEALRAARGVGRGPVLGGPRRRAAAEARAGSRPSWRRRRDTATT